MKKLYIIDASGFLFRSYFAIRGITNSKGESTNALYGFIRSYLKLCKDFNPDHVVAVFDGPNNGKAREEIFTDYKAHRSEMPGDLGYQIGWTHQFCELMGIPQLNIPNVEADDTIGTVAKWAEKNHFVTYICSSDKDLAQLVNDKVFMLNTHKENLIMGANEVEEAFGVPPNKIVDYLAIIGDASDNVPGLSGFGPKTAATLLKEHGSLDAILKHPEKIPGKAKQETIVKEKDLALLSRKLVTLDFDVKIPHEEKFYKLNPDYDKKALREFYTSMNFNSLIKEMEETAPKKVVSGEQMSLFSEEIAHTTVDDENKFKELIEQLNKANEICFKTVTTHTQPLKADLVGFGFALEKNKLWYLPVNGKIALDKILEKIKPIFENQNKKFYGHNVKYDLLVLKKLGINLPHISFDTILASYLLNSHSKQHSLDFLALECFSKVKTTLASVVGKGKQEISMSDVPIEKVAAYSSEEVDYTRRLKECLEPNIRERNLGKVLYNIEIALIPVLAKMESKGIYLDVPFLHDMSKDVAHQIKHLEQKIYNLAGEEFNLNSPKQLGHILFDKLGIKPPKKTATGHSTDAEVLEYLKDEHPLAAELLEYRVLEKLRSTYIDSLPTEVNPHTHRIHCNFNQTVAATGRLACQDPNLQNIPVRTEFGRKIRHAFKPEKAGWSFLSADYSQIELRLLAHLSDDPTLVSAFQHNEDIHIHTAASIFNIPLDKVTKEMRHQAKAVNFGVVYGQQAFGLAQELGIDVKEAGAFIDKYFHRYTKVRHYLDQSKEKARKTGRAVTMTGRERLIPEIHSKNFMLRSAAERLAINTPLQGTAADLIKMAMIRVDKKLSEQKFQASMLLQIHDELIFEAPDSELEELKTLVKQEMESVFSLKVPLVVDISIGKNWEEC